MSWDGTPQAIIIKILDFHMFLDMVFSRFCTLRVLLAIWVFPCRHTLSSSGVSWRLPRPMVGASHCFSVQRVSWVSLLPVFPHSLEPARLAPENICFGSRKHLFIFENWDFVNVFTLRKLTSLWMLNRPMQKQGMWLYLLQFTSFPGDTLLGLLQLFQRFHMDFVHLMLGLFPCVYLFHCFYTF